MIVTSPVVRLTLFSDLYSIQAIEQQAYGPDGLAVPIEVMAYRLAHSPQSFWVAELNGLITGYITGVIIQFDPNSPPKSRAQALGYQEPQAATYEGLSGRGNTLYVASIAVQPKFINKGIGTALIKSTQQFVATKGLQYRLAGLRIAGYRDYCDKLGNISATEYCDLKNQHGLLQEPWLRLYTGLGFKFLKVQEEYYPPDQASKGYGALLVWQPKFI
ncbi:MAG: hypothetical protein COU22_01355 [Candidatus Komeilibacteria bacterium CG10_big_fil_rev_8_21_14_0_10_41_13]|uniref:N-acetyltransferase domain-containing protein n=1 Tax=Candidatus Komeilibacteria bacterium CG10_big_fil_rev_8_21_14_0_10_41_13 TaxID=1974476 RepID=A0A2M6WCR1_9BACT|nr:MAG: hypothetical protein COU22_01355 [Candidatus Komeilibacteria bacterium CG10_big_fil_rev_8_21_14_0_10_41_13]